MHAYGVCVCVCMRAAPGRGPRVRGAVPPVRLSGWAHRPSCVHTCIGDGAGFPRRPGGARRGACRGDGQRRPGADDVKTYHAPRANSAPKSTQGDGALGVEMPPARPLSEHVCYYSPSLQLEAARAACIISLLCYLSPTLWSARALHELMNRRPLMTPDEELDEIVKTFNPRAARAPRARRIRAASARSRHAVGPCVRPAWSPPVRPLQGRAARGRLPDAHIQARVGRPRWHARLQRCPLARRSALRHRRR